MRALIQRVNRASVTVSTTGEKKHIEKGLVVLLGISKDDREKDIHWIVEKIVHLRIFPDEYQKMNLSLIDIQGEVLVVSQFTLYGDCRKGRRPDFTRACPPGEAEKIYHAFLDVLQERIPRLSIQSGVFGAMMEVEIINDGPVTLMVDSKE